MAETLEGNAASRPHQLHCKFNLLTKWKNILSPALYTRQVIWGCPIRERLENVSLDYFYTVELNAVTRWNI